MPCLKLYKFQNSSPLNLMDVLCNGDFRIGVPFENLILLLATICNDSKLTPNLMVLCGLLSLCAQFHTRPLPLFGRVKSVGSYPLSLRLQCKCFRKIISRSRRACGAATARACPQHSRIFAGVLYFPGRALALSSSVAGGDLNTVAVQGYSEKFCESF